MGSRVAPEPPLARSRVKIRVFAELPHFLGSNNPGGSRAPRLTHATGPMEPTGASTGPPWAPRGPKGLKVAQGALNNLRPKGPKGPNFNNLRPLIT